MGRAVFWLLSTVEDMAKIEWASFVSLGTHSASFWASGAVTITGATWPLKSLVVVGEGAFSLFLKARKNGDGVVLWR